ncbi:complement C1q-like protein 4 [Saccostrea cucullata]
MKKMSGLLSRQNVQEKLYRNLKDRLQNFMHSQEENPVFAKALKQHKESLIRRERLLVPVTTTASLSNIVAFYAYLSKDVPSPSGHHILTFDNVITNAGNAYHPHSGTFIAPRSGFYVFTWTIRIFGTAHHSTELLVNNNVAGSTYLDPANTIDGSVTGTVVVHVDQGDDVLVRTLDRYYRGDIISRFEGRSSFAGWALA